MLAAQAYEAAAALERPDLPRAHEPDVAAIIEPLALAAGSGAAAAAGEGTPLRYAARRGSPLCRRRDCRGPGGAAFHPGQAAGAGGRSDGGRGGDRAALAGRRQGAGRRRLRNLLNRLRASCGELVLREDRALVLGAAEIDAAGFERAAEAAIAGRRQARPGLARTALARYGGELLPGDRYEAWATAPRERLRRRFLELLDLLADDAVDRGDVDEAIRLLDRAQRPSRSTRTATCARPSS